MASAFQEAAAAAAAAVAKSQSGGTMDVETETEKKGKEKGKEGKEIEERGEGNKVNEHTWTHSLCLSADRVLELIQEGCRESGTGVRVEVVEQAKKGKDKGRGSHPLAASRVVECMAQVQASIYAYYHFSLFNCIHLFLKGGGGGGGGRRSLCLFSFLGLCFL